MNILVVDDEKTALKDIKKTIAAVEKGASIVTTDDVHEALELCGENSFDVAFLDIEMPGMSGLELAERIKEISPLVNIVIVTAYPQYALDSYKIHASDYCLKPVSRQSIREALNNLRNPLKQHRSGLYVQCFGDFAVFYNGKPVHFGRAKAKEMLAYLIDRKGAFCTNAQIRAALWQDAASDDDAQRHYFANITHDLRAKLNELGIGDIYVQRRDAYAVVPERIACDYYEALEKGSLDSSGYEGEYMSQYEWAAGRLSGFSDI